MATEEYSIFDSEALLKTVRQTLRDIFDTDEWIAYLKNTVRIVETSQSAITSYPAVWAYISEYSPAARLRTRRKNRGTAFYLIIEVYTEVANNTPKEQINAKMRQAIEETLTNKYGFDLTSATYVPSTIADVDRWRMAFNNTQDNFTKQIYK